MADKAAGPIPMIVVMGVTGAGKSYFINSLAGREVVKIGNDLNPYSHDKAPNHCQLVPVSIGNTKLLLLDTPGFDDNKRSDSEILTEIAQALSAQYELGVELKGVIYVHRITDVRYSGSSAKTFQVFEKIVGKDALKNVLLVTSRWAEVDHTLGADRERQLRDEFWTHMISRGSAVSRYHGTRDSATTLVSQLVCKDAVVLELQKELVDEGKHLNQTVAGSFVSNDIEEMKKKLQKEIASIEELKAELREDDRKMRRNLERDWAAEMARLQAAQESQVSLQRPVGKEVQEEITRKRSRLSKMMPLIPAVVGILGAFVGVPPGVTDIFFDWFGVSDVFE